MDTRWTWNEIFLFILSSLLKLRKYVVTQPKEGIQELGKKYIWQFMNLMLGHNQQLILATYKFWIYSQKTFLTTLAHSIPRLFCQKAFIDIFCH